MKRLKSERSVISAFSIRQCRYERKSLCVLCCKRGHFARACVNTQHWHLIKTSLHAPILHLPKKKGQSLAIFLVAPQGGEMNGRKPTAQQTVSGAVPYSERHASNQLSHEGGPLTTSSTAWSVCDGILMDGLYMHVRMHGWTLHLLLSRIICKKLSVHVCLCRICTYCWDDKFVCYGSRVWEHLFLQFVSS